MYLDIGGGLLLPNRRLIAVLRPEVMEATPDARIIWASWRSSGRVQDATVDGIKSLVVLDDAVFLSSVAPRTLKRRAEGWTGLPDFPVMPGPLP